MIEFKLSRAIESDTLAGLLRDIERRVIVGVLEATYGNVAKAAKVVGMERSGLYKKLHKHGIEIGGP